MKLLIVLTLVTLAGAGAALSSVATMPVPSGLYDGTYDLSSGTAAPGGGETTYTARKYIVIKHGLLTSTDGVLKGQVDARGNVTAKSYCPQSPKNPGYGALWTGKFDAHRRGTGTYRCTNNGVPWSTPIAWTLTRR